MTTESADPRVTTRPDADDDGSGDGTSVARNPRVIIVASDNVAGAGGSEDGPSESVADMVEQPAKVMRIGSMIKQLLEEVKSAPLDEASRVRLKEIHENSIRELEQGLSPDLVAELHRLSLPFGDDSTPSDAELRIAQAQLVGWLEGLFHGIQTMLFAQQMAARQQLEQMRALPPGASGASPQARQEQDQRERSGGMYL